MSAQITKSSSPQTVMECITNNGFLAEIQKAIRTDVPVGTMARIVLTQIRKTPRLEKSDPRSFMAAVLTGCQLGLEFGREAHLVPFENRKSGTIECQLVPDYKGLIQLVLRSGQVASIVAENVWTGEEFAYRPAAPIPIIHQPLPPSRRGEYVGSYAMAWMKDGGVPFCAWMWAEEVWKVKARSASKFSPWSHKDDQWEMTKKTAIKRLTKLLPMSAQLRRAVELDTAAEIGEHQFVDVEPTAESVIEHLADVSSAEPVTDESVGIAPVARVEDRRMRFVDGLRARIRKLVDDIGDSAEQIVCVAGLDGMEEVGRSGDVGLLTAAADALEREQLRIVQARATTKSPSAPSAQPLRKTGPNGELFPTKSVSTDPQPKG